MRGASSTLPSVRASAAIVVFAAIIAACSSGSSCPLAAPGTGDSCSGRATCSYGPVSCTCRDQAWQCDLPYTPEVSPGMGDDDAAVSGD